MVAKVFTFPEQIRGDSWDITVTIVDSSNNAIDISGNEYIFTLKSDIDTSDIDADLQYGPVSPGSPDGSNGILNFVIPGNFTKDLEGKTYKYDLQEVTSANKVSTILIGSLRVRKDVTITATYSGVTDESFSSAGLGIYSGSTTTTSPTELYLGGTSGSTLNISENSVLSFTALVVGKDIVTNESCAFEFTGAIERDTGNTTAIIGTVGKTILGLENAAFDASVLAGTNKLQINVTAASANETRWSARVNYTEVSF